MSTSIAIQTQDVPNTFCFTNWQSAWPVMVGLLSASFAGDLNTVNFGNTTPSAEDRDKPWFRLNTDGTPDGWYAFANGYWLKAYGNPGPGAIIMWDGLASNIATLDGGEVGAVSETTGPFWERVTAMDARFPLGVGTYGTTSVAVGGTGGAHEVALTKEEMPVHNHGFGGLKVVLQTTPAGVWEVSSGPDLVSASFQNDGGNPDGSTKAHNNMPPYRGTFFIKRTARLFHRAP